MDRQIQKIEPDYRRIYRDILEIKYPHKEEECKTLLEKENLTTLDVIRLNEKIFGEEDSQTENSNQKYRSYNASDVLQMLDYQKKHHLNNSELARHFKLNRNSVAKWKKGFLV